MTFHDLCVNPLGAADYLVIASHFPEVFIEDVPLLSLETRNEVRPVTWTNSHLTNPSINP